MVHLPDVEERRSDVDTVPLALPADSQRLLVSFHSISVLALLKVDPTDVVKGRADVDMVTVEKFETKVQRCLE